MPCFTNSFWKWASMVKTYRQHKCGAAVSITDEVACMVASEKGELDTRVC